MTGAAACTRAGTSANATEGRPVAEEKTRWRVRDRSSGEIVAEGTLVAGLYDPAALAAAGQTLEIVSGEAGAEPEQGGADPAALQSATIKHQHDVLLYQGDLIANGRTVIDDLRAALRRIAATDPSDPRGLDVAAQVAREALAASDERPAVEGW
jgi:hypothetical protein